MSQKQQQQNISINSETSNIRNTLNTTNNNNNNYTEREIALYHNLIILGLEEEWLSVGMFRRTNHRAMDSVLHFLFSKFDKNRAKKAFLRCWPANDTERTRRFRRVVQDWAGELESSRQLPPGTLRASVLASGMGMRLVTALWRLSVYVLRVVVDEQYNYPTPLFPPFSSQQNNSALLNAVKLHIRRQAARLAARSKQAADQQYKLQRTAQELTQGFRDCAVEMAHLDSEDPGPPPNQDINNDNRNNNDTNNINSENRTESYQHYVPQIPSNHLEPVLNDVLTLRGPSASRAPHINHKEYTRFRDVVGAIPGVLDACDEDLIPILRNLRQQLQRTLEMQQHSVRGAKDVNSSIEQIKQELSSGAHDNTSKSNQDQPSRIFSTPRTTRTLSQLSLVPPTPSYNLKTRTTSGSSSQMAYRAEEWNSSLNQLSNLNTNPVPGIRNEGTISNDPQIHHGIENEKFQGNSPPLKNNQSINDEWDELFNDDDWQSTGDGKGNVSMNDSDLSDVVTRLEFDDEFSRDFDNQSLDGVSGITFSESPADKLMNTASELSREW